MTLATLPHQEKSKTDLFQSQMPAGFQTAASPANIRQALKWLAPQQGINSLVLMLRMDRGIPECLDRIPSSDPRRLEIVQRSARSRADVVQGALEYATPPSSQWRDAITLFPSIHCCSVRAPVAYLRKFLESRLFEGSDTVVAAVLLNEQVQFPEFNSESRGGYTAEAQRKQVAGILKEKNEPEAYLNTLHIGDFSGLWRDVSGTGKCACLIDSGSDESHPALQQQIRSHAFFDSHGHYKEAKYSVDRGCHGTKIAGIVVGRTVLHGDLSLPGDGKLRLGIAPGAKVVSANVLQGECRQKRGTLASFLAGMDWAVEHMHHPELGGFEVVNASIEVKTAFSAEMNRNIDTLLEYLQSCGLVTLLASGNHGSEVTQLGTKGIYVSACNASGKPWKQSGGGAHVMAPGSDLLCCQPPVPQLGNDPVGVYSGTSLACAIVAGCILLLCQATERSAQDCLTALIATASRPHKILNLDDAYRHLIQ